MIDRSGVGVAGSCVDSWTQDLTLNFDVRIGRQFSMGTGLGSFARTTDVDPYAYRELSAAGNTVGSFVFPRASFSPCVIPLDAAGHTAADFTDAGVAVVSVFSVAVAWRIVKMFLWWRR